MKKLFIILCILLVSCSNNKIDGKDSYDSLMDKMKSIDNYTSIRNTYTKIIYKNDGNKEEIILDSVETSKFDKDNIETIYKSSNNYDEESEYKIYLIDGVLYSDLYGEKTYTLLKNGIKKPVYDDKGVKAVYIDNNKLSVEYSDEYTKEKYQELSDIFGIDVNDIKYKDYIHEIYFDEFIEKEYSKFSFTYKKDGISIELSETVETVYSDYNNTIVSKPDDLNNYSEIVETSIEDKLVSDLKYIKDGNVYTLSFNDNEKYIFDFDNSLFTHQVLSSKNIYNWKEDKSSIGSCSYDYKEDVYYGKCSEDDKKDASSIKDILNVELSIIGYSVKELE